MRHAAISAAVSKDIQAQLGARIDSLGHRLDNTPIPDLAREVEALRRLARMHRIGPAIAVIDAVDGALARGERGPLVQGWLALLHDAVGCGRRDPAAETLFAAACSVRLGG